MRRPNPVPPIEYLGQQFRKQPRQPVQSPLAMGGPQPSGQPEIAETVQDLALEIYARLAVLHISETRVGPAADPPALRTLAEHSQTAAKAYFESMGVQFD